LTPLYRLAFDVRNYDFMIIHVAPRTIPACALLGELARRAKVRPDREAHAESQWLAEEEH
jgi:hypothetical protein